MALASYPNSASRPTKCSPCVFPAPRKKPKCAWSAKSGANRAATFTAWPSWIVDPNLEFWPMTFPAPEQYEPHSRRITLECTFCYSQQALEPDEIEEDVYSVNGNVLRFCETCGTSTPWTKAAAQAVSPSAEHVPATKPASNGAADTPKQTQPPQAPAPGSMPQPAALSMPLPGSRPAPTETAPAALSNLSRTPPAALGQSAYSTVALEVLPPAATQFAVTGLPAAEPVAAGSTPAGARPLDASGRPVNRRKHVRVRVNFRACVRQDNGGDDIVDCENVS